MKNKKGIKFFPIASSGLNRQGEYIFRQLTQITDGRFVFLTENAESEVVSGQRSPLAAAENPYDVSALDDLILKIIEEELAYLP